MTKRLTEITADITITVGVLVEHDEDEDIDEEVADQFFDEMTPDDWFRYNGGDRPSYDIDICERDDLVDVPRTKDNAPDIGYKDGRFVAL